MMLSMSLSSLTLALTSAHNPDPLVCTPTSRKRAPRDIGSCDGPAGHIGAALRCLNNEKIPWRI